METYRRVASILAGRTLIDAPPDTEVTLTIAFDDVGLLRFADISIPDRSGDQPRRSAVQDALRRTTTRSRSPTSPASRPPSGSRRMSSTIRPHTLPLTWLNDQASFSTNVSSWRRLRHSYTPSVWVPYSPTIESPVFQ